MTLAALLLAAAAQPAAADPPAPWRFLGEPRPGFRLFYDPTPAGRDGDTVTLRFMSRFPAIPDAPAWAVSTAEIRCQAGEGRVVRTLSYAADGSQTRDDDVPAAFEPIAEGSTFAVLRRAFC